MKTTVGTLAVLTAALACSSAAQAAPTTVKLRVEGATKTIFEGKVRTDARSVDGHTCDGTNENTNPAPGPTPIGALADEADAGSFSWQGTWFDSFQDFQIDRIGPDAANETQFWGLVVNGKQPSLGGCHVQVKAGDEVLWAYDLFSKKHVLLLAGARKTRVGERYRVKVRDGETGDPLGGAAVGGRKTNARGIAKLRFKTRGVKRLKATRADSVRSNQLRVQVLRRKR